jgi:hypothetical protein
VVLAEEEAPFQDTEVVVERTKILSWMSSGPETQNYCAGEGQKQIDPPLAEEEGPFQNT